MWMILVAILFITLYLLRRDHLLRTHKLRELGNKIPGPKTLPIIGNGLEFGFSTKSIFDCFKWLTKEFGPVSRAWIGPKLGILLADPHCIEQVLANSNTKKSSLYQFAEPWLGQGLITSTGEKWKKHRRIVAPTFQGQILSKFVDVFNSNLDVLIEELSKHQHSPAFDIFPYMNLFALDVICESAMGMKMNAQLHGNSDFVKGVNSVKDTIIVRAFSPWLHPDLLFGLSSTGRLQKKYLPIIFDMTKRVIHERQQRRFTGTGGEVDHNEEENTGNRKKRAFLDYLLDYAENGVQFTNLELQDEVNNILFAGFDSTACCLAFTCWLLAKHPHIQDEVVTELKTIFGESVRHCTPQDLTEMKYLEQVIKESLRLLPPVPIFGRILSEDIRTEKYILPAGCEVGINVYLLHRHPDYFPDPEKFDPDRFLPENCVARHPYCYLPFGGGPRTCLGYKFAIHEIKATMALLLRHFRILPSENPFQDLDLTAQVVMLSRNGVRIRLEPRFKQSFTSS